MKLWIGTSGFQYPEWKGIFYPEKMPAAGMLEYYARHFSSTEINYTFRHLPSAKTMTNWCSATPLDFRFSFKAPQRVTHFARLRNCGEVLDLFDQAISAAGLKRGPVLFQLPPNFKRDADLLGAFLAELPAGMRAAFEFRHASWFDDSVFDALRHANAALCLAESEDLVTPVVATADFGYLRLRRGVYTPAQIKRWAKIIQEQSMWSEALVYFKHEETASGPKFASRLQAAIEKAS